MKIQLWSYSVPLPLFSKLVAFTCISIFIKNNWKQKGDNTGLNNVQAVTQTLFILDASRRHTYTADQQSRKPGREVVTFLLVCKQSLYTPYSYI